MRLKLRIEPIPASTWGVSLANKLPKEEWDRLRQKLYRDADYTCEICGEDGITLHAHETWIFDDKKLIQRFAGLECCCELCHNVHHMGRSGEVYGNRYVEKLIRHWCKVNKKKPEEFYLYEKEIYKMNRKRADKQYIVKVGRRILY